MILLNKSVLLCQKDLNEYFNPVNYTWGGEGTLTIKVGMGLSGSLNRLFTPLLSFFKPLTKS